MADAHSVARWVSATKSRNTLPWVGLVFSPGPGRPRQFPPQNGQLQVHSPQRLTPHGGCLPPATRSSRFLDFSGRGGESQASFYQPGCTLPSQKPPGIRLSKWWDPFPPSLLFHPVTHTDRPGWARPGLQPFVRTRGRGGPGGARGGGTLQRLRRQIHRKKHRRPPTSHRVPSFRQSWSRMATPNPGGGGCNNQFVAPNERMVIKGQSNFVPEAGKHPNAPPSIRGRGGGREKKTPHEGGQSTSP